MAPAHEIDLEKQPLYTDVPINPSRSSNQSTLQVYQTLVGDVHAKPDPNDDSIYHEIVTRANKAKTSFWLAALAFGLAVATQIVLCLGIAVGAQLGVGKNAITILAAVNTGVAATIAVLKGLGLPDKMAIERHRLEKIADRIRFTTRKIKAGIVVDAAKEAEDVRKMHEEAEDEAEILRNAGDSSALVPPTGDKK